MPRLTPSVAWLNLTHKPSRLILLLSGIVFAVILMFMFTGFKHALYDSQIQLIQRLNGDIFIVSQRRPSLGIPQLIPRQVLYQAQSYQGVQSASALYFGEAFWKNPDTRTVRMVRVLAFNLHDPLFDFPELRQSISELQMPNTAWVDRMARAELGRKEPGTTTELANQQVRVVGSFTLGNDFSSQNGNLLMSETNFQRYFTNRDPKEGDRTLDQIDIAVIKVEAGYAPDRVAQTLRQRLSPDLNIMTLAQIEQWERLYWQDNTNIGFVFGLLTIMGFFIGIILCYQIIYADIADHLTEYATLKAMGYRNSFLSMVVFQESLLLGVMGFIPGTLLTYALYSLAQGATGLLFQMTVERTAQLLVMTILMCFIAGLVSLVKVQQSDPAEIF